MRAERHRPAPQISRRGRLEPAIWAYLEGEIDLSDDDIGLMRAYLKHGIDPPVWEGEEIAALREGAAALTSRKALKHGIDPL
jgi:hypothetical protein